MEKKAAASTSSWFNVESVPADYSFPADERPGKLPIPVCQTIPVIDFKKLETASADDRSSTVQQIINASQEYGLFQVINHGVSENAVRELLSLYRDFFDMPVIDRRCGFNESNLVENEGWIYRDSTDFAKDGVHLWRDSIKHYCYPLQERMQSWPTKPPRYREVVGEYLGQIGMLSGRILEVIGEGLGLDEEEGKHLKELGQVQMLVGNHYPPCPDPSLTLGLLKHCDPSLITILVQDGKQCGLQVVNRDDQWMGVDPLPNALVVNVGNQLAIISNGKLKSPEHRAVNTKETRTSIAVFINPSPDAIVEPARALVDDFNNPPRYLPTLYRDYLYTPKAYAPPSEIHRTRV